MCERNGKCSSTCEENIRKGNVIIFRSRDFDIGRVDIRIELTPEDKLRVLQRRKGEEVPHSIADKVGDKWIFLLSFPIPKFLLQ